MISRSTPILLIAIFFYTTGLAETRTMPQAIHPATRQTIQPPNGATVQTNPPSLLWPIVKGKDVASHRFRMETAKKFFSEYSEKLDFLWEMRNIDFYGNVKPGIDAELKKEKVKEALETVREIVGKIESMLENK